MTNLTPGAAAIMLCTPEHGEACVSRAPGHGLSALQERVAGATPSKWRDGLVSHVASGGWIGIDVLEPHDPDRNETVWVWSHTDLTASVSKGLPVAVHVLYHTLAVGRERFNVLVAALG